MSRLDWLNRHYIGRTLTNVGQKIKSARIRTHGSHAIMSKQTETGKVTIPVPLHYELAKGTLKSILRQAELSVDELIKLL